MNSNEYNFIIKNEFLVGDEEELFFCGDSATFLDASTDMYDILVLAKIFNSKSQARKSGRDKEIPKGFTALTVGKLKTKIYIFNATEKNLLLKNETEMEKNVVR